VIVTCERCTTQFQLEDSRIPPGGVRVRCSRCKHAFEIELPSPEPAPDPIDRDLEDTIPDMLPPLESGPEPDLESAAAAPDELRMGEGHLPRPEPTAFPEPSGLGSDAFGEAPGDEAESSFASPEDLSIGGDEPDGPFELGSDSPGGYGGGEGDEESDWQFNEDLPRGDVAGGVEAPGAAEVVDQFLGGSSDEPSADTPLDEGVEAVSGSPSGLDLADDSEAGLASLALASEPAEETPVSETPLAPFVPDSPEPLVDEPDGASDELGALGDWDLFSSESGGSASTGPAVRLPVVSPDEISPHPAEGAAGVARWISRAGEVAGWGLVVLLFAYGLSGAFRVPGEAPTRPEVAGDVEIVDADGVWIDNAIAGPIYVISGQLRNTAADSTEPPELAIELLDAEGQGVPGATRLEAPRSRRELREGSPTRWSQGPPPGSGRALASGEVVPFEAIVGALPAGARSYRVVSAPAARRRAAPQPRTSPPAPGVEPPTPEMVADREPASPPETPASPDAGAANAAPPAAPGP